MRCLKSALLPRSRQRAGTPQDIAYGQHPEHWLRKHATIQHDSAVRSNDERQQQHAPSYRRKDEKGKSWRKRWHRLNRNEDPLFLRLLGLSLGVNRGSAVANRVSGPLSTRSSSCSSISIVTSDYGHANRSPGSRNGRPPIRHSQTFNMWQTRSPPESEASARMEPLRHDDQQYLGLTEVIEEAGGTFWQLVSWQLLRKVADIYWLCRRYRYTYLGPPVKLDVRLSRAAMDFTKIRFGSPEAAEAGLRKFWQVYGEVFHQGHERSRARQRGGVR